MKKICTLLLVFITMPTLAFANSTPKTDIVIKDGVEKMMTENPCCGG
ncbi:MAG: hypothetical protein HRT87_03125 [Legionellales bacterium]|nr:hypothetical protein [Legionellales bacterium]